MTEISIHEVATFTLKMKNSRTAPYQVNMVLARQNLKFGAEIRARYDNLLSASKILEFPT